MNLFKGQGSYGPALEADGPAGSATVWAPTQPQARSAGGARPGGRRPPGPTRFVGWVAGWVVSALIATAQPTMNATNSSPTGSKTELATFGGGCFWCLEAVYEQVPGVLAVTNGYAGGSKPNPTYKEVCSGLTGHAEVVQIAFDPGRVSYERLLEIFWEIHDPTSLNRQGNDVGTQYRSVIFYHNPAQRLAAERSKAAAQQRFSRPIVTEIVPLTRFWPAEGYHQDYYRHNPNAPYCQLVIRPKLEQFQKKLTRP